MSLLKEKGIRRTNNKSMLYSLVSRYFVIFSLVILIKNMERVHNGHRY